LNLDISRQRLDSTHVSSNRALFGRTKLMAAAIKRFLTQVERHSLGAFEALPKEFRKRYEAVQSCLFADAKDAETRIRCRQQAAEDLLFIIEYFANDSLHSNRSSYQEGSYHDLPAAMRSPGSESHHQSQGRWQLHVESFGPGLKIAGPLTQALQKRNSRGARRWFQFSIHGGQMQKPEPCSRSNLGTRKISTLRLSF